MQQVLFVADSTVDSAIALSHWLIRTPQPVQLTVVWPYTFEPGLPLHKTTCQPIRDQARQALDHWLAMLQSLTSDRTQPMTVRGEVLLGDAAHVATIHLLLRSYDIYLTDERGPLVGPDVRRQAIDRGCRIATLSAQPTSLVLA